MGGGVERIFGPNPNGWISIEISDFNGALENKNLEHFDPYKLLENLEDWERYLQSDQELIEKLRSLERHSLTTAKASVELRGPRL